MHSIPVPKPIFDGLVRLAAAKQTTPESLAVSTLDQFVKQSAPPTEATLPLSGEAWRAEWNAMILAAAGRADRYPPGHTLDDSRESIYGDRLERQL
jgi:hypothetical protein